MSGHRRQILIVCAGTFKKILVCASQIFFIRLAQYNLIINLIQLSGDLWPNERTNNVNAPLFLKGRYQYKGCYDKLVFFVKYL